MNNIEKKVKREMWRQRIGYGSSDFACNLIWQVISLYLLYFYTNVMHLNAAQVSVMFLVTRLIDGAVDLVIGYLIDKTNTKWGKSRPWILGGAIPFAVTSILAFSVPNLSEIGMLIYAYVTYTLLSIAYTAVNIPMASILTALSEDANERTTLAAFRTFFASLGSTVVSAFTITLVAKFGGGNEAVGYRIVMALFGIIGCALFFFCFFNTKERVNTKAKKVSVKANLLCLIHNKPWRLFALNIIWYFGGYIIEASALIYYFTYVIGNKALASVVATIWTLVPIGSNLITPFIVKYTKKRNVMILGCGIQIFGLLVLYFGGTSVPMLMAGAVISAGGHGFKKSIHFAMQPDPVDYGEWKSGVDTSGTLSAVNAFVGKVGMAVAGSLAAALLAAGGFDAKAAVQSQSAINAIVNMYIWVPIGSCILSIITMSFYDLDKMHPQIIKELNERRLEELAVEAE